MVEGDLSEVEVVGGAEACLALFCAGVRVEEGDVCWELGVDVEEGTPEADLCLSALWL